MSKNPNHTEAYKPEPEAEPLAVPPKHQNFWQEAASSAPFLAAAIVVIAVLYLFIFRAFVVDGQSMQPTLQNSDRLIVGKLPVTIAKIDGHPYVPKRGNIIIFNQSDLPGYAGTKQLVKRVIGLPGERIVVKNGQVTVFNKANPRGFNPDNAGLYRLPGGVTIANRDIDLTLGPNQIYVLGDNRQNSEDSRYFGPIYLNQIVGELWLRIWPLGQTKAF